MDQDDLSDLPAVQPSDTVAVGSSGMIESINQEEEEVEEDMEEDDEDEENEDEENIGQLSKRVTFQTNSKSTSENGNKADIPKFKAEGLMKLKKASKMREKKEKKDRR